MKKKIFLIAGFALFLFAALRLIAAGPVIVIDTDGNGSEVVSLDGSQSRDPDGAIIDYQWRVNGTLVESGFGPKVSTLNRAFNLGNSTVTLTVRDDVQVSSTTQVRVTVKPASSNLPPVANATVPSIVKTNFLSVATVTVNASASSDPEGDRIYRYRWTEGTTTYYDGGTSTAAFVMSGIGVHTLTLTVYSVDTDSATQSGTKNFSVTLKLLSESLAGREFTRIVGEDFSFDPPYQEFSGITFNPVTQTFFVTENSQNAIVEINPNGSLVRTVDLTGLKRNDPLVDSTDVEGITWVGGRTFALTLEKGEEMAIVTILSTTTAISRAQASIYTLSGDPKGIAYKPSEDAFYWVSEDSPMKVIKSKINTGTGELDKLAEIDVTGLPASDLGDIAYFPRLSPHMLLLGHSSATIMEVDLNSGSPVLKSTFSLTGWPIPDAEGLAFGPDGKMYVVGKHKSGVEEDDFNIFQTTVPFTNQRPVSLPGLAQTFIDSNGNGNETVTVDGSASFDPDGTILDYQWAVNSVVVSTGFGPRVKDLVRNFVVGKSTVTLIVRDDLSVSSQAVTYVTVKPQSSNLPPVANASVPSSVEANYLGEAQITVNASASSDPENNPIIRYRWTEGTTTYYDGTTATAAFTLNGIGLHVLTLNVTSIDSDNAQQTGGRNFNVTVLPLREFLAGREFSRIVGQDFSFDPPYTEFSGISFNPLTQTFFMTENSQSAVIEINPNGSLVRTINVAGLKRNDPLVDSTDVEGITWMYGTTYALTLEKGEELAVVTITTATTVIPRANATIYTLSGDPKGVTYKASEDAFYWVSEDNPMKVIKSKINTATGQLDKLSEIDVTGLPSSDLGDIAYFPRLSPHLLLVGHSSATIMEVDLNSGSPVLKSTFSLTGWPIPDAEGLSFGPDGKMYVVGKHKSGVSEDDFNVFQTTFTLPNLPPEPKIETPGIGQGAKAIDRDGNGSEVVLVDGLGSFDRDGAIIDYEWRVNGIVVKRGFGPKVEALSHEFAIGDTTVELMVRDDVGVSSQAAASISVLPPTSNLPPIASANVPGTGFADSNFSTVLSVDASLSSDPDNDPITRYRWTESGFVFADSASSNATFTVNGLGQHRLTLTVYSEDGSGLIQTDTQDFFLPSFQRPPASSRAASSLT